MPKLNKRQQYLSTLEEKKYTVSEAFEFLKGGPKTSFEEAVDIAINLGIDASKSDQTVRSSSSLPAGTGKPCKVAVFAEADQAKEALDAGADAVGMEDLSDKIKKGDLVIIASYCKLKESEVENHKPKIIHVNEKNEINNSICYQF